MVDHLIFDEISIRLRFNSHSTSIRSRYTTVRRPTTNKWHIYFSQQSSK